MKLFKLLKITNIFVLLLFVIHTSNVLASSNDCLSQIWTKCKYREENFLHKALNELCVFNNIFYGFLNSEEQMEYSKKSNELYRNFMLEKHEDVINDLKSILQYIHNKLIVNETPPSIVLLRHKKQIQELLEKCGEPYKKKSNRKLATEGAILINPL